jgi:hypothetical protein
MVGNPLFLSRRPERNDQNIRTRSGNARNDVALGNAPPPAAKTTFRSDNVQPWMNPDQRSRCIPRNTGLTTEEKDSASEFLCDRTQLLQEFNAGKPRDRFSGKPPRRKHHADSIRKRQIGPVQNRAKRRVMARRHGEFRIGRYHEVWAVRFQKTRKRCAYALGAAT